MLSQGMHSFDLLPGTVYPYSAPIKALTTLTRRSQEPQGRESVVAPSPRGIVAGPEGVNVPGPKLREVETIDPGDRIVPARPVARPTQEERDRTKEQPASAK